MLSDNYIFLTLSTQKMVPWFAEGTLGWHSMLTMSSNVDGLLDLEHCEDASSFSFDESSEQSPLLLTSTTTYTPSSRRRSLW